LTAGAHFDRLSGSNASIRFSNCIVAVVSNHIRGYMAMTSDVFDREKLN